MVRPMVHSTKHIVQKSIATIDSTPVVQNTILIDSVAVGNKNIPNEVEEGSDIKAIWCEFWIRSATTAGSSGNTIIFKKSSDTTNPSVTEMAQLHDWDNKKNILFTQQGLFNDVDTVAIPIIRQWLKIPKGKQRFGLGDKLVMSNVAIAVDQHICGFSLFKEYS